MQQPLSLLQQAVRRVQQIPTIVQRAGVLNRPTMTHPTLQGYADPNNHFARTDMTAQHSPVNPFQPFSESHIRALRPPSFRQP